ncbi:MAG: WG repeat-containing protein [Flavobacteriales bacterium]|nr:WG repeat-containing protein [Flavobacteriales bacterium]
MSNLNTYRTVLKIGLLVLLAFGINDNKACGQIEARKLGDKYAFFKNGVQKTDYTYTEVSAFSENLAWANMGELYAYIDTNFEAVTDWIYTTVTKFENGFAAVSQDSMLGFIDKTGREICPLTYTRVQSFQHGFAAVLTDSLWNIIDTSGNEIWKMGYDFAPIIVSNNFFIVCKNQKWGVINQAGNAVYPFDFEFITKDGLAFRRGEQIYLGLK